MQMNPWLLSAALAAAAICLLHIFLGGRQVVPQLLAAPVHNDVKHTHYYCWHLVTLTLALMAAGLAWAGVSAEGRAAGWLAAALAVAFIGVNIVQNLLMRLSFRKHPQGLFFLVVSALGIIGLASG